MACKILIVEDEEIILELLSEVFRVNGNFEVTCARDGEEAISMFEEIHPDIILLDVNIPKINGYEICRHAKSSQASSGVKVIMVSGMSQKADLQKGQEAGADLYLTKPFNITKLLAHVNELIKNP